jgi:hypothetical protein
MPDVSPDHDDRIKDFLTRHGGAGNRPDRSAESSGGLQGWSETYAQDGYTLRCEWSQTGSREEMRYSEIAPGKESEREKP